MKDSISIYESLGWELTESGSQLLSTCPFCGKSKMYVDPKRAVYDCKVCHAKGNQISVLQAMFEKVYRPALNDIQIGKLAKFRGLPIEAIKLDETLGFDPINKRPVFLTRKPDGSPVTIRRVLFKTQKDGSLKARVLNMADTNLGMAGVEDLKRHPNAKVYLCEGEWDRIAMKWLLRKTKTEGVVLSVPGAGTFKQEWAPILKSRDVVCLYDNDKPGREGGVRLGKMIKAYIKTLHYLRWDEEKEEGYDINDLVRDNLDGLHDADEYIRKSLHSKPFLKEGVDEDPDKEDKAEADEQESLDPIGVEQLHKVFHKWLHLENCDLLDVVMGCLWSVYLPGSPLWLFVVAPPSGSKSETLMPASAWFRCFALSNVTSKGLISGFQLAGGEDPSLFAGLQGKPSAIIVKDMTPVLNGNPAEREEIFGILRDAYDGAVTKVFGNGVRRHYENLKFSVIAGVTPAIDCYDSVALGERFLKFRSDKELEREDDVNRAMRAVMNCGNETQMRDELKDACVRSLVRKFDLADVPKPDEAFARIVSRLAGFCAKMRAAAPSDKFSDIQTMSPLREAPARLAIQFTKFAQGLAMHLECDKLTDPKVLRLIKRVAVHTPDIITMRIVQALYEGREATMLDINQIRDKVPSLSQPTIASVCTKLARTKAVEIIAAERKGYRLAEETLKVIQELGLFDNLPKNDPLNRGKRFIIRRPS